MAAFEKFFKSKLSKADARTKASELAPLVGKAIDQVNRIQSLSATIVPFIYSYVTTDSRNKQAMKALSEFEQASLPMSQLMTQFTAWVGRLAPKLDQIVKVSLGEDDAPPVRIGAIHLENGEDCGSNSGLIDAANGYAYYCTYLSNGDDIPGSVVKLALGDGDELPTRLGALQLNAGERYPSD